MEKIINAWRGWRLEFEEECGGDCDGATEYSTFSEFEWTIDLAEIIKNNNKMLWLPERVGGIRDRYKVYIEEATDDELKVHCTGGYAVTLTKEKPSYEYRFCFGHHDYCQVIRLLAPGVKAEKIARLEEKYLPDLLKDYYVEVPKKVYEEVVVPEAVDLGLSVDWAPYNLGATAPERLGDEYAWSSIEPDKEGYSYIRGLNDDDGKPMYNEKGNSKYEFSGMRRYDAATAVWGDGWRTPTEDELWELKCYCKWKWVKVSGRYGYRVTGKSGKSIFLPVNENYKDWKERSGSSYWSSHARMLPGGSTKGDTLDISEFIKGDMDNYSISDCDTAVPLYIRPVKDRK